MSCIMRRQCVVLEQSIETTLHFSVLAESEGQCAVQRFDLFKRFGATFVFLWLVACIIIGAPSAAAADFALAFDGTNDYVQVASAPELTLSNNFTIEFWFKPATTSQLNTYLLSHNGLNAGGQAAVIYEFTANAVEFYATGFSGADPRTGSAMIINDTQWHHVAYSYNGTNWTGYLDGLNVFAVNRTFSLNTSSNDWFIGSATPGVNPVAGTFDEVRIWNFGRSKPEIQADMNRRLPQIKPGLVAYYQMDEGTGTLTADHSAHSFSGTLVNGPQWVASDAPIVPDVKTLTESGVSPLVATFNAEVNPLGRPTTAWFEWGLSTNYGNMTAVTNIGNGPELAAVFATVEIYPAGQTHYYRIVATNANGLAYGAARSFTPPAIFAPVNAGLTPAVNSSAQWGDYDNDGRLDILISGGDGSFGGKFTQIWRNTPSGFVPIAADFLGFFRSSVAWCDYNNDGLLDVLISGLTSSEAGDVTQVWRNTGAGFVDINAGLPGAEMGSVAWGDYDNDGRPDILLAGLDNSLHQITQLWRNTPSGFTNVPVPFTGVDHGSATWCDYDNDGRLDVLITGTTGFADDLFIELWRNTPGGFVNVPVALPAVANGAVAWGDYDNDGRMDVLLTGINRSSQNISQLWRNTPAGFVNINAGLPGVSSGHVRSSAAWGDFDNDGRLDILLGGATQVWRNTPGGFEKIEVGLPAVGDGSMAWGDYDNDGRLDILITGSSASGPVAGVWRNNYPATNTPPVTPSGLSVTVSSPLFLLQWNPGSDSQTPTGGLTYNLRIGTTPGGSEILSPMAGTQGYRRVSSIGNAQSLTSATLFSPVSTTYYWSVQSVDGAFAGSAFAPEQSFTAGLVLAPTNGVPVPGDINGDGKVDDSELHEVLTHYWPYNPVLQMTNVAGLGSTNITFDITNSFAGDFNVEVTTNLTDWQLLGPATPRYYFSDTNSPAESQRFYRLRWP